MTVLALLGGSFLEPDPLNYLFGAGIGTNLGASIVWGVLGLIIGVFIGRRVRRAWTRMHDRVDDLHRRHDEHHELLAGLGEQLDRIANKTTGA